MIRSIRFLLTVLAVSFATHAADASIFNRENVIGAAVGGLAGGIIGHQSNHRTEGAILGSVAGYAIGSVVHNEKNESRRDRHDEPTYIVVEQQVPITAPDAWKPEPAPAPEFSKTEERQLLLQSSRLFSVK